MNDRILEIGLEETLGGVQPPDVVDRVVAALAHRAQMAASGDRHSVGESGGVGAIPRDVGETFSVEGGNVIPLPLSLSSSLPLLNTSRTVRAAARRPATRTWIPLALAASLLLAIGGYWLATSSGSKQDGKILVASRDNESQASTKSTTNAAVARSDASDAETGDEPKYGSMAQTPIGPPTVVAPTPTDDSKADGSTVSSEQERSTVQQPEIDSSTAGDAIVAASLTSGLSTSATSDDEIIAFINTSLKTRWKDDGVRPSPAATESEWCRRVYLDTIGRIPTINELEAFLVDNARNKRARLVDRLLTNDGYLETYARFWTTIWTNLLIGRTGGMEPNSPVNRAALEQYLRRAFLTNKPYNQLVYELITAQGSNRPGDDDYNGAVNFLLAHLQERATPATAKTSQIFLGLQVQCTQCHNHPFNDWKQNRFWEMNAFFRQMRDEPEKQGNQLLDVRLTDHDFAGEGGDPREAEVYFEQRNGIMQIAYPTFIDGTAIDPNGLVDVVNRRRELARFVIRSDEMKRAIVNRLWAHFLGYGFTKPVDDLGPHNPPSHPELLARLAEEFAGHGYDLKRLVRWIALSDAYALSSKFGPKLGNAADDPTMGTPPLFSHFYVRQMSAEQLYESLLVATGAERTEGTYEQQQRLKDEWLKQFAIAFGTDENDEATTFDGTIAQTLVMMNGEMTRKATSGEKGSFLSQVSMKSETSERAKALNELYLAALARRPSRAEVQVANNLLTVQAGNTTTALEDIWWALLNSNEFILQH